MPIVVVRNFPLHFRSCDSTFGFGASREDESGWFLSSDNIGGDNGEIVNSDFKFSCPESNSVENLPTNHASLKSHSSNDADMISAPVRLRDSPWISEKHGSYESFVNLPTIANVEEGFTPKAQVRKWLYVLRPLSGLTFHNSDVGPLFTIEINVLQ